MKPTDLVFWHQPAALPLVVDCVVIDADGVQRSHYTRETLDQIAQRYRDPKVCTVDEFIAMHDDAWRTDPNPCDAEVFQQMLEELPPVGWVRVGGAESFKFEERISGRMTSIFARIGDRYWTFVDRYDLTHDEIMARVMDAKSKEGAPC